MTQKVFVILLLTSAALARAVPALETQYEFQPIKESSDDDDSARSGWRTWDAFVNWIRPTTNYITSKLPDKSPSEFVSDVRDTAVDLRDQAADHPVVQGLANVIRPVHRWVSEKASELSKTSFRDMYEGTVNSLRRADETVADWLNRRNSEQQLQQYNYDVADGIEQELH